MFTLLAVFLLILALTVHEAGHAIAMKRYGIAIEAAGIGFGPHLTLKLRRFSFLLTLGVAPLGAYVRPSKEGIEQTKALLFKEQAVICAAGPLMNFLFAAVLLAMLVGVDWVSGEAPQLGGRTIFLLSLTGLLLASLRWLEAVSAYVIPVLGVLNLAVLALVLAVDISGVAGPVGVAKLAVSLSLERAVVFGVALSLGLGLFNIIPFMPLDGGRIVEAWIRAKWSYTVADKYSAMTTFTFLAFFCFILTKDVITL